MTLSSANFQIRTVAIVYAVIERMIGKIMNGYLCRSFWLSNSRRPMM